MNHAVLYSKSKVTVHFSSLIMLSTTQPTKTHPIDSNPLKTDYAFINWVRLIAMFSIVMVHCLTFPAPPASTPINQLLAFPTANLMTNGQAAAILTLEQCMRFGTLHFFIVAGFLIGKTLKDGSAISYFRRRLTTIAYPFLIAFGLYYLKSLGFNIAKGEFGSLADFSSYAVDKLIVSLLDTPYWFIPTYFFSLAILLACRLYLARAWFGWILVAVNLLYAVNVYTGWLAARHNYALFGFLFYLWLGYIIGSTDAVMKSRAYISTKALAGLTIALFGFALLEIYILFNAQSGDPVNSLRLSNQLFAIALFFLLTRVNYLHKLPFLHPRTESFGIYLYHMFFVIVLGRAIDLIPQMRAFTYQADYSGLTLVILSLLRGLLIYTLTLLFVKAIATSRWRWLIGLRAGKPA
ncbi:acyltransferase family protein [Spirosoma sordidisoli]|uniref:Acyltransferase n=1 Tax=Spirosoma sordidisoli TaxID=2502893 RepID=A0A4Q2UFH9_9BACT|nr:acyltransferase [Spirosoma sordidisoli]RYC67716.1 acyltransferase [Spirosoma sordidisoli]